MFTLYIGGIFFGIFLCVSGFILICKYICEENLGNTLLSFFTMLFGIFLIIVSSKEIYNYNHSNNLNNIEQPTALDVYRGNTELHIIYEDSIIIDSIVKYKK